MLLHGPTVATVQPEDLIRHVAAAGCSAAALPVPALNRYNADRTYQLAFFGAPVFFDATARADTDRRPFFSAASIRRATASCSICCCNSRPSEMTAVSQ